MHIWLLLALACRPDPRPDPIGDADIFVDRLGDPVPFLDDDRLIGFEHGREVMVRAFTTDRGLGPFFNADSCASCHQFPVAGGSAPRYRDFWLVKRERWDGALENVGTNGSSPVRNLYATAPAFHMAEPIDATVYARRNTPPGFGVGLFAFVSEQTILEYADPDDADGDGISGRPNYEQDQIGRFGYKSQATSLESFNRGALLNQMGITTDPMFYTFPEDPERQALQWQGGLMGTAWAQVAAPDEPTVDDDDVRDPEMSMRDQIDLLLFSTFLGVPRPTADLSPAQENGAQLFTSLGCADCHRPRLDATVGTLPAYTDLLIHDMGPELADQIAAGLASGSEFRTQPLWGVALHGPWLHDGRADTLEDAIAWHGGEGQAAADAWAALQADEQADLIAFLHALGGSDPQGAGATYVEDRPPEVGEPGGPDALLSDADQALWLEGRALFDRTATGDGLGPLFNADSCRACHQDPVLGGAGGLDTNVLRFGHRAADDGEYEDLGSTALPRVSVWGERPMRLPDEANIIEPRNPPTTMGMGAIGRIPEESILRNADPDDVDGDGVSGRVRMIGDVVGRYGWKAQIPAVSDFVADALLNEKGLTVDPALSDFTMVDDGDAAADPEESDQTFAALTFYLEHLAPPMGVGVGSEAGAATFDRIGCADCHTPELGGVALYSDLLLHDVAPDAMLLVSQDEGVDPGEFRTPPLWGVAETGPYLHDGSAPTLETAVTEGHFGEAASSRQAYLDLTAAEQADLWDFVRAR
ncbi:MAG: di-heme oxidoredictase family protein [Myxococcota bacterium]